MTTRTWLTNATLEQAQVLLQQPGRRLVIDFPKATAILTVDELRAQGMVGIYELPKAEGSR